MQKRRGGSVKIMVALSALAALGIILGKFLAINVTTSLRFSLENMSILFAGIVFGPIHGAALGAVQDIVGCVSVGYEINPLITLGAALNGFVGGVVYKLTKKFGKSFGITVAVASAHTIGSVLVKTIGLSVYYGQPFFVTMLWRILNYAVVGTAEVIILKILLNSKQLLTQINKFTIFDTPRFSSLKEAESYIKTVSGVFSKPGLERVDELLASLGNPQKAVKAVHVAGTNGKGSFSAMLTSILRCSHLKVGSFNSPYLIEMRESIRIDGEPISEEKLTLCLDELRTLADKMADKPTEFELLTAAAFLIFKREGVDVAVIECGMGGGSDATNVIDSPLLSVITGVSVDHTSYLGTTVTEIAEKKAGIIKPCSPVLFGGESDEVLSVIRNRADELKSPIHLVPSPTIREMTLGGTILDHPDLPGAKIPLLGLYQPHNASIAISAAKLLRAHFPTITDTTVRTGLAAVSWPGRFELLSLDPVIVFDGAHNLEGVDSSVKSAEIYFDSKAVCLTGVLADKDYKAMAELISKISAHTVTIAPDSPRALSAVEYADVFLKLGTKSTPKGSVSDGLGAAIEMAKSESLPVICLGSLYLYKDVIEALKQQNSQNM